MMPYGGLRVFWVRVLNNIWTRVRGLMRGEPLLIHQASIEGYRRPKMHRVDELGEAGYKALNPKPLTPLGV